MIAVIIRTDVGVEFAQHSSELFVHRIDRIRNVLPSCLYSTSVLQ